jgi:DNA-binding MarR family transcriptional regulator
MSTENPNDGPYLGALLRLGWQFVREEIYSGVLAAGYDDLNPAHVGLFRYPTLDRLRPSEVADQLRITRQSVNDLLGHLEQHGYLTREAEPPDRRARVVRLTVKGHRLEKIINARAKAAELKIAQWLGPRSFAQLRSALETVARNAADNEATPQHGSSPRT